MRIITHIVLLLISLFYVSSNFSQVDSTTFSNKKQQRSISKPVIVSLSLFSLGLIANRDKGFFSSGDLAEERNEKLPTFHSSLDDYLQYAPIALTYGAKFLGAETRNNLANQTALLIKSELMMMAVVFPLKEITQKKRPDNSARTSFPSGHTAQAFVAASFMSKELGSNSIWYSVGAYTTAATVGIYRVLNNRHDATDVLFGAGIGILVSEIAYATHQHKWRKKRDGSLSILPTYNNKNLGIILAYQF